MRALVNLEKPWRAIRVLAGLYDVRLHHLRHAFASVAALSGMGLPIIGNMFGHTQAATRARYAHLASDPVKATAAAVARKIAAAMAGGSGENRSNSGVVTTGRSRCNWIVSPSVPGCGLEQYKAQHTQLPDATGLPTAPGRSAGRAELAPIASDLIPVRRIDLKVFVLRL